MAVSLLAATLLPHAHVSAVAIRGSVIASGGLSGTPAANGTYRMIGTAGQPAADVGKPGGTTICSGSWCYGGWGEGGIGPRGDDLPKVFAFVLVSANPTRGPARFELSLPRASRMTLRVFDVNGRQVGDALDQRFEAGRHRVTWGTDLRHSGVYFARLTSEYGFRAKRKIVVVR